MIEKILIITPWYPTVVNGVRAVFIREQAIALTKKYDVFVHIIARHPLEAISGNIDANYPFKTLRSFYFLTPSLKGYTLYGRLHPRIIQYFSEFNFRKILDLWGKPDIIHAHVVWPAGYASNYLGTKYHIPTVLTEHSCPFSMHTNERWKSAKVCETLHGVNQVIAVSPALADTINSFFQVPKIEIIGNVIHTDQFYPKLTNSNKLSTQEIFHFLIIASLDSRKGIQYLLDAAKLLLSKNIKEFHIWIAGKGPLRKNLENMVLDYGLANNCTFLGRLNHPDEVREWMQVCDAIISTSLHETFNVVLGEAMACGKPVIATRSGGPDYVVDQDTGVLVNSADAEDIAHAMIKFIRREYIFDPDKIRQSVSSRFGQDAFVQNISRIYDNISILSA